MWFYFRHVCLFQPTPLYSHLCPSPALTKKKFIPFLVSFPFFLFLSFIVFNIFLCDCLCLFSLYCDVVTGVVGVIVALFSALVFKLTKLYQHPSLETALMFIFAYLPYMLAEALNLSGFFSQKLFFPNFMFSCFYFLTTYQHPSLETALMFIFAFLPWKLAEILNLSAFFFPPNVFPQLFLLCLGWYTIHQYPSFETVLTFIVKNLSYMFAETLNLSGDIYTPTFQVSWRSYSAE